MSDCGFGVSPVNYPDPELIHTLFKIILFHVCDKFTYCMCIKYLVPWCTAMKNVCKEHAILFNLLLLLFVRV